MPLVDVNNPDRSLTSRTSRTSLTAVAAIILVTVAAWLPSLAPYVPVAEDFSNAHVPNPGVNAYWQWFLSHSQQEGLWRVVGLPFTDFARNLHPLGFPLLSILFHGINGGLTGLLCRRLGASRQLSFGAALCFAVLPAAVEANLYAVASQSIQATTVFLLLALSLARVMRDERPRLRNLAWCFMAAFVGNTTQENLLIAYVVLPVAVAHVLRPIPAWTRANLESALAYSACTFLAVATYAGVTMSLRTGPTKAIGINLTTLVSFPAYQYTNLFPYEIWAHPDLVAVALGHQPLIVVVLSAALLVAGLVLARPVFQTRSSAADAPTRARERRILEAAIALWYSAGLIFVLGGGYSFESRKKYVTLMFLSVVMAFVATRIIQAARDRRWRRLAVAGAAVLVVVTAATTWMVSSLWVLETQRGAALVRVLIAHPEIKTVHVRFMPDILDQWPRWVSLASSQHSSAWVTEFAMELRFNRSLQRVPTAEAGAAVIECRYLEGQDAECHLVGSP